MWVGTKIALTIHFLTNIFYKLNSKKASRLQTAGFWLYSFNNLYYSSRPHIGQYSISIPLMNTGKLLMPMLISSVLLSHFGWMDYDLIVVKTLERVYKNYYYIIRGEMYLLY